MVSVQVCKSMSWRLAWLPFWKRRAFLYHFPTFFQHEHASMLLAGVGYGPASNKVDEACCAIVVRAGWHCSLLVEQTSVATLLCLGSNSGAIRNAGKEAPRRWAAGGPLQREFPGASVAGSLFLCRSGCQKLPKRRGRVCCAGFETGS